MQSFAGLLTINLGAVRHNWRAMRAAFTGPVCGAVVKANAYGLGYAPVVHALFSEGCRSFFVANYSEAVDVKKLLADRADIYVLQGCPEGLEADFVRSNIIPVLVSESMLRRWFSVTSNAVEARCAIKVNTGMNRLGLSRDELIRWLRDGAVDTKSSVTLLMSHLACADTPGHPLNDLQLQCFSEVLALARNVFPDIKASLSNSAAISLGAPWHFDLARPGIALYGGREGVSSLVALRSVVTVSLPVIQVRSIKKGEWVGYGASFCASADLTIATVGGGYADGFIRAFSNKAFAYFSGVKLPLVGRVSMDSCVFDISSLPPELMLREGDLIEVLGEHCDITAQAELASTISYELLTRLGERLQKHYVETE